MALTNEEQRVLRNAVITYSEYLEGTTGQLFDKERRDQIDKEETPDWFYLTQKRALNLIRKKLAQSHLVPRNRWDYLDLKQDMWVEIGTNIVHTEAHNYQELFRDGLSEQIRFMRDEEVSFSNGWLNAANSINIGGYGQSMTPDKMVDKIFKDLAPLAYDNFETMGWTYACINHPLEPEMFYKMEH